MNFNGKRYWLVGASEGLGRALAHKMSAAGAELVISARSEERLNELAKKISKKVQVMPLDLADGASVARVGAELGRVDGVIFLASVYWPFPSIGSSYGSVFRAGCRSYCYYWKFERNPWVPGRHWLWRVQGRHYVTGGKPLCRFANVGD